MKSRHSPHLSAHIFRRWSILTWPPSLGTVRLLPAPASPALLVAGLELSLLILVPEGDPGCDASNWLGPQGSSNPSSFAPAQLNTSQWVDSMVALGATEAVLTAKHGCGFYLWPTNVTLPNGTLYPYHVDTTLYGVSAVACSLLYMTAFAPMFAAHGLRMSLHSSWKPRAPGASATASTTV